MIRALNTDYKVTECHNPLFGTCTCPYFKVGQQFIFSVKQVYYQQWYGCGKLYNRETRNISIHYGHESGYINSILMHQNIVK